MSSGSYDAGNPKQGVGERLAAKAWHSKDEAPSGGPREKKSFSIFLNARQESETSKLEDLPLGESELVVARKVLAGECDMKDLIGDPGRPIIATVDAIVSLEKRGYLQVSGDLVEPTETLKSKELG